MGRSTLQINFQTAVEAAGASLSAELLAEDNGGATQIPYGQAARFRVYKYPPEMVLSVIPSDGSVAYLTSGTATIEGEFVEFVDTAEGQAQRPVASLTSYDWLGNSLGTLTATGGERLAASVAGVAVARVSYTASYELWSLTLPQRDADSWQVVALIRGVVPQPEEAW